jgi:cell division protein FtsL
VKHTSKQKKHKLIDLFIHPLKFYLRILLVVFTVGIYQYQSIRIDILAREIRSLELKRDQLINDKARIQIQIDQLTHLSRIEKIARERFGLVSPGQEIERLVIKKYDSATRTPSRKNGFKLKLAGVQ